MQEPGQSQANNGGPDGSDASGGLKDERYSADLDVVAAYAEPGQYHLCLDVACGTGHTTCRIASKACVVVGVDSTESKLAKARDLASERDVTNVVFQRGEASALPFLGDSFDLITCRIAPHHFADVPGFLAESHRVLRHGGRLVLEDCVTPADPQTAELLERLSQLQDPTHERYWSAGEWRAMLEDAGFSIARETTLEMRESLDRWLADADTGTAARDQIATLLRQAPAAAKASILAQSPEGERILVREKLIIRAEKA